MKKSIYTFLFIYITIFLSFSLNGQVIHSNEIEKGTNIQRNASFNVEEIKVRWKKAALENCPGVPCTVPPTVVPFTCGTSTITDIDNNTYNTVLIGAQCWMKTNLKVTKYNDGTLIGDSTNSTWGTAMIGAHTGYDVSLVPLSDYVGASGYLYNWYAATDSRKLCPAGWHVPTDAEWTILIQALDPSQMVVSGVQSTTAGTAMKSTVTNPSVGSGLGWNPGSPGTNISGFSALPGGYRLSDGSFLNIRDYSYFWSATGTSSNFAFGRNLLSVNAFVLRISFSKSSGASIRCLRD